MKELIKDFKKFRKAGFLRGGTAVFIFMLLPSLTVFVYSLISGVSQSRIIFAVGLLGDIFVACLVPFIITGCYNRGRYILYATLPLKNNHLIGFIYLQSYLIIISGFLLTGTISAFSFGLSYFTVQIFKIAVMLCLCNLYVPMISSPEFIAPSEGPLLVVLMSVVMTSTFLSIMTVAIGPQTLINLLGSYKVIGVISIADVILALAGVLTYKKSYAATMKKVRLTGHSIGNNI